MNKSLVSGCAVLAASLLAGAPALAASSSTKTYTATLLGKNEVPKGSPHGSGTARITLNASKGQVCYTETWKGIKTPTASHIHQGKAGTAGAIVVALFSEASHRGCVKASKSVIAAIEKSPSGYYVNIHTSDFAAGAIRGQL